MVAVGDLQPRIADRIATDQQDGREPLAGIDLDQICLHVRVRRQQREVGCPQNVFGLAVRRLGMAQRRNGLVDDVRLSDQTQEVSRRIEVVGFRFIEPFHHHGS